MVREHLGKVKTRARVQRPATEKRVSLVVGAALREGRVDHVAQRAVRVSRAAAQARVRRSIRLFCMRSGVGLLP